MDGRIGLTHISRHLIGSGSFGPLILGGKMTGLCIEFGLVFFMKVVVLYHTFPMPQKSSHLNLYSSSYGQMNLVQWQCTTPRFDLIVYYVIVIFWA